MIQSGLTGLSLCRLVWYIESDVNIKKRLERLSRCFWYYQRVRWSRCVLPTSPFFLFSLCLSSFNLPPAAPTSTFPTTPLSFYLSFFFTLPSSLSVSHCICMVAVLMKYQERETESTSIKNVLSSLSVCECPKKVYRCWRIRWLREYTWEPGE